MGVTRVVFGPATFLDEAARRATESIQQQIKSGVLSDPAALQQAQQQLLQSGLAITSPRNAKKGAAAESTPLSRLLAK